MKKIQSVSREVWVYAKLPFPFRVNFADDFIGAGFLRVSGRWWGAVWRVVEEELDGQQRDDTI